VVGAASTHVPAHNHNKQTRPIQRIAFSSTGFKVYLSGVPFVLTEEADVHPKNAKTALFDKKSTVFESG
jgi:hypothetical protein